VTVGGGAENREGDLRTRSWSEFCPFKVADRRSTCFASRLIVASLLPGFDALLRFTVLHGTARYCMVLHCAVMATPRTFATGRW
jgi:hypothetical protein